MAFDIESAVLEEESQPSKFDIESAVPIPKTETAFDTNRREDIEKDLLNDPVGTLKRSGSEFIGGIAQSIGHPIDTLKSLDRLVKGAIDKAIPGTQPNEATFDAVVDFYKDRYGGIEQTKKTLLQDPIGAAADLSMFMTGGAGLITKVGKTARIAKLANLGKKLTKAGRIIDPVNIAANAIGKTVQSVGKARKFAPFASKIDPGVTKAAEILDIDLPASAKTTSKIVPLVEGAVAKGFFGNKFDDFVASASNKIIAKADDLVTQTGKSPDLSKVGVDILEGSNQYRNSYFKIKNQLYDKVLDVEKGGAKVSVRPVETLAFMDDIIKNKSLAKELLPDVNDLNFFKELRKNLSKSEFIDGKIAKEALKELNEKLFSRSDPVLTGNKAKLTKFAATLSEELDIAIVNQRPDLSKAINTANETYKIGLERLNSSFGKTIDRLKNQPDKILPAIFNKNMSAEDIPRIFEVIGTNNKPSIQAGFMEELFKRAKNTDGSFTPQGLSREINKIGDTKLNKILNKQQVSTIKNLEKVRKGIGRLEKVTKGSQTAFSLRAIAEVATLFQNPLLGLKFIGGDALLSSFVSSKLGQKLLTTGIKTKGIPKITRAGEKISGISPQISQAISPIRAISNIKAADEKIQKNKHINLIRSSLTKQDQIKKQLQGG